METWGLKVALVCCTILERRGKDGVTNRWLFIRSLLLQFFILMPRPAEGGLGEACTFEGCDADTPNSVCTLGECVCKEGFTKQNNVCVANTAESVPPDNGAQTFVSAGAITALIGGFLLYQLTKWI